LFFKLAVKKRTIVPIYAVSIYTPFNNPHKDNVDNLIEDITVNKRAQFLVAIEAELNPNLVNSSYLLKSQAL